MILARGSRFGGYSLFVKGGELVWTYNFLGVPPEQRLVAEAPKSGRQVIGVEFSKEGHGEFNEGVGTARLFVGDTVVAEAKQRTMTGRYSLCGEGLCIGYDGGDAVSSDYGPGFACSGGRVIKVVFDLADDQYIDVERELAAALARE